MCSNVVIVCTLVVLLVAQCLAIQASKDACLQIFSVPKQTVECEPSQAVMEQVGSLEDRISTQSASLAALSTSVSSLDPAATRKLRDDVTQKLTLVDDIRADVTTLASTVESSQTQMSTVLDRVAAMEQSNNNDISTLIQMQTALISEMWTQTNGTTHQMYLAKLEQVVQDVQDTLSRVETELVDKMELMETKLGAMSQVVDRWQHITPRAVRVHDCDDALKIYEPISGVYSINPGSSLQPYDVYCDMVSGGGEGQEEGWTVIQRRMNGSVDFFRAWVDYWYGFGDAAGEYWLGLEKMHVLTADRDCELIVNLQDWDGRWLVARYDSFSVGSADTDYTLHVSGYSGDAGDSLTYHDGMSFSTIDHNNDLKDGLCSTWCHGAWWFKDCFMSNLNGRYYQYGSYVPETNWGDGVNWKTTFNTYYYSFKTTSMKIRAKTT